jgi:hypothetical protein
VPAQVVLTEANMALLEDVARMSSGEREGESYLSVAIEGNMKRGGQPKL